MNATLRTLSCSTALLIGVGAAHAQGQVSRVSVATGGTQTTGVVESSAISGDGRYVAFSSDAPDLVPGDTNNVSDVFVHDRQTTTTTRVSVSSTGIEADGPSGHVSISEDGRFVVFHSLASNLEAGDLNSTHDVFVHDRTTGSTRLLSRSPFGTSGSGRSFSPAVSGDGEWVIFFSEANDLDLTDANPFGDAFFVHRASGVISIASLTTAGGPADWIVGTSPGVPGGTGISRDGRMAVFTSEAGLDPVDINGGLDIYVRDRVAGTTRLVSLDSTGQISLHSNSQPAISGDGRTVVFYSGNPNFVPGDTNGVDAIVRDLVTGATERVSVDSFGAQVTYVGPVQPQLVGYPSLSYDGRFVAFETAMQHLVPGDTGTRPDVFVHDRLARVTQLISRSLTGVAGSNGSVRGAISADGAFVAFQSSADDLVQGDTNLAHDIFVGVVPDSPLAFCFGDGSGTLCPCGNGGARRSGCANSVVPFGARLVGTGRGSVGDDTLTLLMQGLPPGTVLTMLQGTAQITAGAGATFGDGLRCVGGAVVRLGSRTTATGRLSFGHTVAGDAPISVAGQVPPAGGVRHYQAFYRNAAGFCTSATFNLSNGVSVAWTP